MQEGEHLGDYNSPFQLFFSMLSKFSISLAIYSGGSRGGRNRRAPPLNFYWLDVFFFFQFCIIPKTLQLPLPISGPWTLAIIIIRDLRSLCVMRAHVFAPPLFENPGSAPDLCLISQGTLQFQRTNLFNNKISLAFVNHLSKNLTFSTQRISLRYRTIYICLVPKQTRFETLIT